MASSDWRAARHERVDRQTLATHQADRLKILLRSIYGKSAFYTKKLDAAGVHPDRLTLPDELTRLPFTTKAELVADQDVHAPWGSVLSEPLGHYTRYSQTSSTTGRPLRWLDTNESWQQMLECWKSVYRAARVGPGDRVFFAFSFGPFFGFWTAFEAAVQIGAHAVPGGGMSSRQRLALIDEVAATVVCCTPTYALRLAQVAAEETPDGSRLAATAVRTLILAGEPGGSIPATRERIERAWGARVIDHHGLTEVGPVSFECWERPGYLHLNENEFLCEIVDPATLEQVPDGTSGELVVTSLCRAASPVIRYRTGDIVVRRTDPCPCGRTLAQLEGGILSRADDMVNVRGVNVYPGAIESVVRRFEEVVEFRSTISNDGIVRTLSLEVELAPDVVDEAITVKVARALREAMGLNVPVRIADAGTLPRFDMKARRLVIEEN